MYIYQLNSKFTNLYIGLAELIELNLHFLLSTNHYLAIVTRFADYSLINSSDLNRSEVIPYYLVSQTFPELFVNNSKKFLFFFFLLARL